MATLAGHAEFGDRVAMDFAGPTNEERAVSTDHPRPTDPVGLIVIGKSRRGAGVQLRCLRSNQLPVTLIRWYLPMYLSFTATIRTLAGSHSVVVPSAD